MEKEITDANRQKFNRDGVIFTILLIISTVTIAPLILFLGYYGLLISAILFVITMYFAIKVERYKKENDIQTFKEILAFTEGKRLDEFVEL